MRQSFDQKLQSLQEAALDLGRLVEQDLADAVHSLLQQDIQQAEEISEAVCREVGQTRGSLEQEILALMATQQPVAGDLRSLIALLEILAELEWMGNYAASIAQTTIRLGSRPALESLYEIIASMADRVRAMLGQALVAFERHDISLARSIPPADHEIDRLYELLFQELLSVIRTDSQVAPQTAQLSRVAHNLERTADRVVNLCEWVIFAATGEMRELNAVGGENTSKK
jgi:phosphate transport system protein